MLALYFDAFYDSWLVFCLLIKHNVRACHSLIAVLRILLIVFT